MKALKPHRIKDSYFTVPGDKSIAHRAALLALLSKGPITVRSYPNGADCQTSLKAVETLGVKVDRKDDALVLTPPEQLVVAPELVVDCANSGTTARLLAGIIAGSDIEVTLTGDESLQTRPMKRIIDPLTAMGAELFAEDNRLPVRIRGHKLLPFEYRLPVASAQVKSSVLLAGLASHCTVTVREDVITRDHTELMIAHLGEGIETREIKPVLVTDPEDPRKRKMQMPEPFKKEITVHSRAAINGGEIDLPGDISTAAFFFAAAAISGKSVTMDNLGLNPTRTAFLDHLKGYGARVEITNKQVVSGETRGTVRVVGDNRKARRISGETTVGLIDEIPIVAVMAAFADGTTVIRDAAELRVKESDRLAATAENLKLMGVKCGLLEDGLAIESGREIEGADFKSYGDHRIAMAFTIASLFVTGPSSLDDEACVAVSCPEFFDLLEQITL